MEQNTEKKLYHVVPNANKIGFSFDGKYFCPEAKIMKGQSLERWSKGFNELMEHDNSYFNGLIYSKLSNVTDILVGIEIANSEIIELLIDELSSDSGLISVCASFAAKQEYERVVTDNKNAYKKWSAREFNLKTMANILTVIYFLLIRCKSPEVKRILNETGYKLVEVFHLVNSILFSDEAKRLSSYEPFRSMAVGHGQRYLTTLLYVTMQVKLERSDMELR